MEKWKQIKEYENYEISNFGNIRRIAYDDVQSKAKFKLPYILKPSIETDLKYFKVTLFKNGKAKHYRINRLVALHFIDNPLNKPEVNHKDGNGFNNHHTNLEWVTKSENIKHRIKYLNPKFTSKKVNQYDLNGNFIKEYKSCEEAGRQNNIYGVCVARCARGERKKYKNFIWKYCD
jgi:predicted nucleic acid-binding OB-fold protein